MFSKANKSLPRRPVWHVLLQNLAVSFIHTISSRVFSLCSLSKKRADLGLKKNSTKLGYSLMECMHVIGWYARKQERGKGYLLFFLEIQ